MAAEIEGKGPEEALIGATYALLAERGRDHRKKLLLSEIVSREKKDAIQAELLREGEDVQPWLDKVYEDAMRYRHLSVDGWIARLLNDEERRKIIRSLGGDYPE